MKHDFLCKHHVGEEGFLARLFNGYISNKRLIYT